MTKEEWQKEPDEYKIEWGNDWVKRVLTRGPAFRFTPPKLSDDEKEIDIQQNSHIYDSQNTYEFDRE